MRSRGAELTPRNANANASASMVAGAGAPLCHLAIVVQLVGAGGQESGAVQPPAPMRLAPPPPFGHELRDEFMFDPNTTNFNHGS